MASKEARADHCGPTAESFRALHPPPGVISRCPEPGPYSPTFRLCIDRPGGPSGHLVVSQSPRQSSSRRRADRLSRSRTAGPHTPAPRAKPSHRRASSVGAAATTARNTREAKPVTPDCSCSPGPQAARAEPSRRTASLSRCRSRYRPAYSGSQAGHA